MRRYSFPLFAVSILLVGCPTANGGSFHPTYTGNPTPTASPTPSPTPQAGNGVLGTLYDEVTGQPVGGATVLVNDHLSFSDGTGSFTGTLSAASGSVTILKSGYENLTVHGYQGGALPLTPTAAEPYIATMSTTIQLSAPAGVATDSVLAIAVKPSTHAYFASEVRRVVPLSASGTGSFTLDLPMGDVIAIAYSSSGQLVGTAQGAVAAELGLSMRVVGAFSTYTTAMDTPTDGSVINSVGYSVHWPSSNSAVPNYLSLASATGVTTDKPVLLPPLGELGLSGASYNVNAAAVTNENDPIPLGYAAKEPLDPGSRTLSLLPATTMDRYYSGDRSHKIPFSVVLDHPVPGANAHVLELSDADYGTPRWKVVSLGTSTDSLYVPILSNLYASHDLPYPASYRVRLDGAVNPLANSGDRAQTFGREAIGNYNP